MNFCNKSNTALFFSSVDEISNEIWTHLDCENNIYLHRNFLKSIEKNHPNINFKYIILVDENLKPKAFTSIQIINFNLEAIQNNLESFTKKVKEIGRKLHIIPNKKPLKILISGNTFVSGEHGIFINQTEDKKSVIKDLAKAILQLTTADNKLKIDAFLLKDFENESLLITDELKNYGYHPFSVEPNMILHLNDNWQNFEDYLAAMKTKFRVKAKKALQLSGALKIETVTLNNINQHLPKMTQLYQKVATNASFNLADFNLQTYIDFKANFGDNYILKTYWLNDKIVGFLSGIINHNALDAHFVGIDYKYNKTHAIYQRMLYDYVQIAIQKKVNIINFGRTASEIKSSVGAEPNDLTIYLRHKKRITNRILKLFLQGVQPTPFQQKFPFKKINLNENYQSIN